MTREPDPTGFDDIVASWQREGGVPQWPVDDLWHGEAPTPPDDRTATDDRAPVDDPAPVDDRAPADDQLPGARAVETSGGRPDEGADPGVRATGPAADPLADEHFVPPEPPPLPRIGPPMLVGLTLIVLGLVLVTFPGWVGVPQVYGLPLGLVAIASGLGWLVLRLWPDSSDGDAPPIYLDDPDDPDGGAVL